MGCAFRQNDMKRRKGENKTGERRREGTDEEERKRRGFVDISFACTRKNSSFSERTRFEGN